MNKTKLWNIDQTPGSIWELKNFNNVNTNLLKTIKEKNIKDALIFVYPCAHWYCNAFPLSLNNPSFDGDIVWAKNLGEKNIDLIKAFPGKNYYYANYETSTISPIRFNLNEEEDY